MNGREVTVVPCQVSGFGWSESCWKCTLSKPLTEMSHQRHFATKAFDRNSWVSCWLLGTGPWCWRSHPLQELGMGECRRLVSPPTETRKLKPFFTLMSLQLPLLTKLIILPPAKEKDVEKAQIHFPRADKKGKQCRPSWPIQPQSTSVTTSVWATQMD